MLVYLICSEHNACVILVPQELDGTTTENSVTLTWQTSKPSTDETTFHIQVAPKDGKPSEPSTDETTVPIQVAPASETQIHTFECGSVPTEHIRVISGLTPGTKYTAQVRAVISGKEFPWSDPHRFRTSRIFSWETMNSVLLLCETGCPHFSWSTLWSQNCGSVCLWNYLCRHA